MKRTILMAAAVAMIPSFGFALTKVADRDQFMGLVNDKTLARSLIQLSVNADGSITGRGSGRAVTGTWTWEGGYFCRNLKWGQRDLGYNCQEVSAEGTTIRFQSDRGTGDSADFTIR
jgi:hypothetical protein